MALGLFDTPPERPRIKAGSFSRLDTFEKCPKRAFFAYVEKRPEPADYDRTAATRGDTLHKRAEAYVKGESEDTEELTKITEYLATARDAYGKGEAIVEQEWAFDQDWVTTEWFAPTTWLRVKCDVVLLPNAAKAHVWDWKSGRKDGNEVKHIGQGQLYGLSTFMRMPEIEVVEAKFIYLDHGKELARTYTRADVPRLLDLWSRRLGGMTGATDHPAKPNKINCKFCPYSDNRGGDGSCPWRVAA